MEQDEKLCECGHPKSCHHDGEGVWGKGCNQPIAMELKCPCKRFFIPDTGNDVVSAAKAWLEANTHLKWTTEETRRPHEAGIALDDLNRRPQLWAERLASFAQQHARSVASKWIEILSENDLPKETGEYLWHYPTGRKEVRWYDASDEYNANIVRGYFAGCYEAWMRIPPL